VLRIAGEDVTPVPREREQLKPYTGTVEGPWLRRNDDRVEFRCHCQTRSVGFALLQGRQEGGKLAAGGDCGHQPVALEFDAREFRVQLVW
jgi:hypothetical protein